MSKTVDAADPSESRRPQRSSDGPIARALLALTDLALAAVIFLAPLFLGGRHDVGRLVYVGCVVVAAVCWLGRLCVSPRPRWRLSGAEFLILGGVVLLVLQLVPLPAAVIERVSPEQARLLPAWTADGEQAALMGTWNQLSLTPRSTQGGLVTFLAHGMLFLVVLQRIRQMGDVERLLRWLALAAIGMAILGLSQMLLGNGKFLWIYEHPERTTFGAVRGSFPNQNHFAHFLILGLGPLFWWLQRMWSSGPATSGGFDRSTASPYGKPALLIGAGLVLVAILLTFSRGGVVTAGISCFVVIVLMTRGGLLKSQAWLRLAGLMLVLSTALAIYGYEPLARRMSTLRDSQSLNEVCYGRTALWEAHLAAIPKFLIPGTGAGSHREIYHTYMTQDFDTEFTHGENGYLHLTLEMGVLGLLLAVAGILLAWSWCLRVCLGPADRTTHSAAIAVLAGLLASAVHSLGDFVWYIPACLSLTVILAACACRVYQLNRFQCSRTSPAGIVWRPRHLDFSRPLAVAIAIGGLLLATMMVADRKSAALASSHWDAYYRLAVAERNSVPDFREASSDVTMAMLKNLHQTLQHDPHHARAHIRMAQHSLREFEQRQSESNNPMPLDQIRDAALASNFETLEKMNRWLSVVMGDNRRWLDQAHWHALQALRGCPLYGDGYAYLAQLDFLEGGDAETKAAFVEQAVTVQPHSGVVLVAAGREAALLGDYERALDLWKLAFHQDRHQRQYIIEELASQAPAAAFVEYFQPDTDGLRRLFAHYRRRRLNDQALEIADGYAKALQDDAAKLTGDAASRQWVQAASVYEFAGNVEQFLAAARHAVMLTPSDFGHRRLLIRALVRNERFAEAVEQLQWCISRQPDDPRLQDELQRVYRQQLTHQQARVLP